MTFIAHVVVFIVLGNLISGVYARNEMEQSLSWALAAAVTLLVSAMLQVRAERRNERNLSDKNGPDVPKSDADR